MAKWKLTKKESLELATLGDEVSQKYQDLNTAVDGANEELKAYYDRLKVALDNFNQATIPLVEKVGEAEAEYDAAVDSLTVWVEAKADEFDTDYHERSDRWRDSDEGTEAGSFVDTWNEWEVDKSEVRTPFIMKVTDMEDFEVINSNAADEINELPEEADIP